MKLSEIARALGGELRGDGAVEIVDVAAIEDAPPGTLTFLADRRLAARLATSRAAAVLLPPDAPEVALPSVRVAHPYLAFVAAVELLHPPPPRPAPHLDPSAVIAASARLVRGAGRDRGRARDQDRQPGHGGPRLPHRPRVPAGGAGGALGEQHARRARPAGRAGGPRRAPDGRRPCAGGRQIGRAWRRAGRGGVRRLPGVRGTGVAAGVRRAAQAARGAPPPASRGAGARPRGGAARRGMTAV